MITLLTPITAHLIDIIGFVHITTRYEGWGYTDTDTRAVQYSFAVLWRFFVAACIGFYAVTHWAEASTK